MRPGLDAGDDPLILRVRQLQRGEERAVVVAQEIVAVEVAPQVDHIAIRENCLSAASEEEFAVQAALLVAHKVHMGRGNGVNAGDAAVVAPAQQRKGVVVQVVVRRQLIQEVVCAHIRVGPHLQEPVQPAIAVHLVMVRIADHVAALQFADVPGDSVHRATLPGSLSLGSWSILLPR